MSNKRLFCLLLLLSTIMVSGCKRIEVSELYGTYVAKYSFGVEKLSLKPNGEYIQEVSIKGNPEVVTHKGNWRYDSEDQYPWPDGYVILEDALSITDGFGRLKKDYDIPISGSIITPVERHFLFWGRIEIGSCEGTLYVKQK